MELLGREGGTRSLGLHLRRLAVTWRAAPVQAGRPERPLGQRPGHGHVRLTAMPLPLAC